MDNTQEKPSGGVMDCQQGNCDVSSIPEDLYDVNVATGDGEGK